MVTSISARTETRTTSFWKKVLRLPSAIVAMSVTISAFSLLPSHLSAQTVLTKFDWSNFDKSTGDVLPADANDPERIRLTFPAAGAVVNRPIAMFAAPAITKTQYSVRGRMRFQNVTQPGYVEM